MFTVLLTSVCGQSGLAVLVDLSSHLLHPTQTSLSSLGPLPESWAAQVDDHHSGERERE